MTQLEVIKQIIAFFTIPVTGCNVDDEQEHFRNVVEFQLKNYEKENEKKLALKHRLEKLELLKQEALKFKNESFPETDPPFYHIAKIDRFTEYCTKVFHLENSPEKPTVENQPKPKKYTAKEYALSYILDLYALGKQIPQNRVEGGISKKELIKIGAEIYGMIGDTFYRAVKELTVYDLNKSAELQIISNDWQNVIANLSNNWEQTKNYLIEKGLYRE